MIETMEATEIEKQRHHSTRMEALVRLAELEVCVTMFRMMHLFLLPCFYNKQRNIPLFTFVAENIMFSVS